MSVTLSQQASHHQYAARSQRGSASTFATSTDAAAAPSTGGTIASTAAAPTGQGVDANGLSASLSGLLSVLSQLQTSGGSSSTGATTAIGSTTPSDALTADLQHWQTLLGALASDLGEFAPPSPQGPLPDEGQPSSDSTVDDGSSSDTTTSAPSASTESSSTASTSATPSPTSSEATKLLQALQSYEAQGSAGFGASLG